MIAYTNIFGDNQFRDLLHVMKTSLARVAPTNELVVEEMAKPEDRVKLPFRAVVNFAKFGRWLKFVEKQKTGTEIIVADCDLMFLSDPFEAFRMHSWFDVAYTVRRTHAPINAGILWIRVNKRSWDWLNEVWKLNAALVRGPIRAAEMAIAWASGCNQSAMFNMICRTQASGRPPCRLMPLPCERWNMCQEDHADFDEADPPVVVHLKSDVRVHCRENNMGTYPSIVGRYTEFLKAEVDSPDNDPDAPASDEHRVIS